MECSKMVSSQTFTEFSNAQSRTPKTHSPHVSLQIHTYINPSVSFLAPIRFHFININNNNHLSLSLCPLFFTLSLSKNVLHLSCASSTEDQKWQH